MESADCEVSKIYCCNPWVEGLIVRFQPLMAIVPWFRPLPGWLGADDDAHAFHSEFLYCRNNFRIARYPEVSAIRFTQADLSVLTTLDECISDLALVQTHRRREVR